MGNIQFDIKKIVTYNIPQFDKLHGFFAGVVMIEELREVKNNPLVTIVMAIYNPREDWLTEQLVSLNSQTYENLELIICDDCSDAPVTTSFIQKFITRIPIKYVKNDKNIGSNKTFELLTAEANGEYIAYCDQDDIWEANKIELLVNRIDAKGALLCCSDLSIIDENGHKIADSITNVRKHHVFKQGENLAPGLVVSNFVTGCAMIIRTDIAKAAVPFDEYMVHDHWLALFASLHGTIAFEPETTVKYRQHQRNQTAVLAGVYTKDDYYRLRIELQFNRISSLKKRCNSFMELTDVLERMYGWIAARRIYFNNFSLNAAKKIWKGREFGRDTTFFELVMPLIPGFVFKFLIRLFKR